MSALPARPLTIDCRLGRRVSRGASSAGAGWARRSRCSRRNGAGVRLARELASVPAQSRPAAGGHRPARVSRSEIRRRAARGGNLRARPRGRPDGGHRLRVRAHRAPAQHARRASADLVGAGAAATRKTLVERLFRAYFLEGRFIGDRDVLAAIAGEARTLAPMRRARISNRSEGADAIAPMDRRVRELGVDRRAVLHLRRQVAVSGAQEPRRSSRR